MLFVADAVECLESTATTVEVSFPIGISIVYETATVPTSAVKGLSAPKRRDNLANVTVTMSTSTPAMSAIPCATAAFARVSRIKASIVKSETVKDRLPATDGVPLAGATVPDTDVLVTPVVCSSDLELALLDVVEPVWVLNVLVTEEVVEVSLDEVGSPLALEMLLAIELGSEVVLDMFDKS